MRPATRGVLLALATAMISGLAVYLNAFGVRQVSDAAVYTTAKNGVAALILLGLVVAFGRGREVRALGSRQRLGLLAVAVVGGSVPFVLFFTGLAMATAPTAAFIHKTLFIWVAMLAVPFLGERLGGIQIVALLALLAGVVLVSPPTGMGWGTGETLIAVATVLWSVEVIVAKRLMSGVSSQTLGAARMGLGFVALLGYLALSGNLGGLFAMSSAGWFWIIVTGVLLAGYVATWYGALSLAPATTVTAVLVAGGVVTAALSAAGGGAAPGATVAAGYLLIITGVIVTSALALGVGRRREARHADAHI